MVNPIILIAALLGIAFLYPLVQKLGRITAAVTALAAMTALTALVLSWLPVTAAQGYIQSQTAGFTAPLSINLAVGFIETVALSLVFLVSLLALFQLLFEQKIPGRDAA